MKRKHNAVDTLHAGVPTVVFTRPAHEPEPDRGASRHDCRNSARTGHTYGVLTSAAKFKRADNENVCCCSRMNCITHTLPASSGYSSTSGLNGLIPALLPTSAHCWEVQVCNHQHSSPHKRQRSANHQNADHEQRGDTSRRNHRS